VPRFLIVRPSYDTVSRVLHSWADEVRSVIEANGSHIYVDLSGSEVTRTNVEAKIEQSVDYLIFYGHGTKDALLGAEVGSPQASAVLDTSNGRLLKNKVLYVVGCHSSATLGPRAVKQGAVASIGYRHKFYLIFGAPPEEWFKRAANAAMLDLLDESQPNRSFRKAFTHAKEIYKDAYNHYKQGNGMRDPNRIIALGYLKWNGDNLTLDGDPEGTFLHG
jgi:Peptidase family C25